MNRNRAISETELIRAARDLLRNRLPPDWLVTYEAQPASVAPYRPDAVLDLTDSEGRKAYIVVEVKARPIEAREVSALADQLRCYLQARSMPAATYGTTSSMVVAPYLGPSARERLAAEDISFADLTGNVRFRLRQPAVFIETQGAAKNPQPENAPLRSLKGPSASRAVRAFLDYRPPYGIRELAAITGTPAASLSRVAELLAREAILEREAPRGKIATVDWERLLRRWVQDYHFTETNSTTTWLEPRGLPALLQKLESTSVKYALTGSLAAVRYAPTAEPRLAALYVHDPSAAADLLGLRRAETGGNVLLAYPFDRVVFDRTTSIEGMTYAKVTQVAADLLTGPGRSSSEAESLIEWMKAKEDTWRIPLPLSQGT